jgi:hypothetical protein
MKFTKTVIRRVSVRLRQHTYGKLSFSLSIQLLVPTEKRAFFG